MEELQVYDMLPESDPAGQAGHQPAGSTVKQVLSIELPIQQNATSNNTELPQSDSDTEISDNCLDEEDNIDFKTLNGSSIVWSAIGEDLRKMRLANVLCDATLVPSDFREKNTYVHAHSVVLAAGSLFFKKLYVSSNTIVSPGEMIVLKDINTKTLQVVIDFLYGIKPESLQQLKTLKRGACVLSVDTAHDYIASINPKHQQKGTSDVNYTITSDLPNLSTSSKASQKSSRVRTLRCPICFKKMPYERVMVKHLTRCCSICKELIPDLDESLPKHVFKKHVTRAVDNTCHKKNDTTEGNISAYLRKKYRKNKKQTKVKLKGKRDSPTELQAPPKKLQKVEKIETKLDESIQNACLKCNVNFPTPDALVTHLWQLHKVRIAQDALLKCKLCNKVYRSKAGLVYHNKKCHKHDNTLSDTEVDLQNIPDMGMASDVSEAEDFQSALDSFDQDETDDFKCPICDDMLENNYELGTHLWKEHKVRSRDAMGEDGEEGNFKCNVCDKMCKTKKLLLFHKKSHSLSQKCKICDKEFKDRFKFLVHLHKDHPGAKYFLCSICGRKFNHHCHTVKHLNVEHGVFGIYSHMRALRAVITPLNLKAIGPLYNAVENSTEAQVTDWAATWLKKHFPCCYCDAVVNSKQELSEHIKVHLKQEKELFAALSKGDYECHICGDMFQTMIHLNKHKFGVHEERYVCKICNRRFHASVNLCAHLKTHGGKHHHCQVCGRAFKQAHHLQDHMRTHSDVQEFSCDVCGQQFKFRQGLRSHYNLVHNPDYIRNFVCDVCGYRCHTRQRLTDHRHTHTGERPHVCQQCGKGFKTSSHVKRHMKIHDSNHSSNKTPKPLPQQHAPEEPKQLPQNSLPQLPAKPELVMPDMNHHHQQKLVAEYQQQPRQQLTMLDTMQHRTPMAPMPLDMHAVPKPAGTVEMHLQPHSSLIMTHAPHMQPKPPEATPVHLNQLQQNQQMLPGNAIPMERMVMIDPQKQSLMVDMYQKAQQTNVWY